MSSLTIELTKDITLKKFMSITCIYQQFINSWHIHSINKDTIQDGDIWVEEGAPTQSLYWSYF